MRRILKLLDVLLSPDMKPCRKKEILESEFDIPMTEPFEREVEDMCNLSKGVEERGIQKGMEEGIQKGLREGMEKGIQKGRQEGIRKGRREGIETTELQSIKSLMQNLKMTAEQAMEALNIAFEKREKYSAMLGK